ncbi:MAG: hypothetical protein GF364_03755 [Candidatus Lokiarchaeota archaeon]|nr:hypothetical protein [Candidatus Lokiarchaeota archaeon]
MAEKITADIEILFHPDLSLDIKEIRLLYSLDGGKAWDDYYANKLSGDKYNITMYDMPENAQIEFYIEILLKDGRVMKAQKKTDNYKTRLLDQGEGVYKAQVRIREVRQTHRKCIICGSLIQGIQCTTPECEATYCPICNRLLPPHSNYCPWDKQMISDS